MLSASVYQINVCDICEEYVSESLVIKSQLTVSQGEPNGASLISIIYMLDSYQGEVVRVNPDNAEVRVVCVILSNFLQDLKELKTI